MYAEPTEFDREIVVDTLLREWGIAVGAVHYEPLGFGSHHYSARDDRGDRWFVTVDDLSAKPWMAPDNEGVVNGLERALLTALTLRAAGLDFVHAPTVRRDGRVLARIADRYAMSVFAFVDGRGGEFADTLTIPERRVLFACIGRLHGSTGDVPDELPRRDPLGITLRDRLIVALSELETPWSGGPYSERVRELLAANAGEVRDMLAAYDDHVDVVRRSDTKWVITHGEPHPGNLIWTSDDGFQLVDWDTVALAPVERDLWDLGAPTDEEWRAYRSSGGSASVDPDAVELYRLRWSLDEIAYYVDLFRSKHQDDANTVVAWSGLKGYLPAGG